MLRLDYVDRGIALYGKQSNKIKIFSDELGLLERYEKKRNIEVIAGGDELEVFHSLMAARTLVISNSTFSLCAAYLSNVVETLVRPLIWSRKYLEDELTVGFGGAVIKLPNSFYAI